MVLRAVILWCLDRAQDVLAFLLREPLSGDKRLQPLTDVAITFRAGWWGDLHPDDAAQLSGRWQSHAILDALLLFESLPVAPSFELVLRTAPPGFFQAGAPHVTEGGVTVVSGTSLAGPMWLLWHPGATLVVVGKFAAKSTPWTVRRFIDSAAAGRAQ